MSGQLPNGWAWAQLGVVLDYEQPTPYLVESTSYNDRYETPVLTAGKTFILGRTNEATGIFPQAKLPVIIFDDFTTASKFVDFPFKAKSSAMKILKPKPNCEPYFVFMVMQAIRFSINRHKRYWISEYSNIRIPLPPASEQKAIASALQEWNEVVTKAVKKVETLVVNKQQQFKWLLKELIGKLSVEHVLIRAIATELSCRNADCSISRVLSVTNRKGFALPEEQFKRRVASDDLSNYKVVRQRQYAYNPSRINVGSIARLDDWDAGVLSPMYVVFELDETRVDSDYFKYWLSSSEAKQKIRASAQGSVRQTVSYNNFAAIPIALPALQEQKRVANILNAAYNMLEQEEQILQQLAEKYESLRQGFMQKLLTGEWRVPA